MYTRLSKALGSRRLSGLIGSLPCGQGREDPEACWTSCDLGSLWSADSQCRGHGKAEEGDTRKLGSPGP